MILKNKEKIGNLQYSFLDLYYIIKELKKQGIEGSKIEKVYQPKQDELVLQLFYIQDDKKIKTYLSLNSEIVFLSDKKSQTDRPPFFCEFLRKRITNFRIKKISQMNSDRILLLELENSNNQKYELIIELFGKGNIILVEDGKIKNQIRTQKTKTRLIMPKQEYILPEKEIDLLKILKKDEKEIIKTFKIIEKNDPSKDVVHFIASDLNFGGKYSNELCFISKLEKQKKIIELKKEEWTRLINSIKIILKKKTKPTIYYNNLINESREIMLVTPFELKNTESIKTQKKICQESYECKFYELVKEIETKKIIQESKLKKSSKSNEKTKKLKNIIKIQTKQLTTNTKNSLEWKAIGEKIYENYQEIDGLLKEINKIREKEGWTKIKELIKEKYFEKKSNKIKINKINEKNGKISIEIK